VSQSGESASIASQVAEAQVPPVPGQRTPLPRRGRPGRAVLLTTAVCATVGVAGHGLLWAASANGWMKSGTVPWQPVTGIVLVVIAVVAFGGFYIASQRARIAIASSFLLTFLVALTYVLTIERFAKATLGQAKVIFDEFRNTVAVIIGFYFGSEAAVSVTKIIAASRAPASAADVRDADRDLANPR
jgi:hypothetical protein